MSKIEISFEKGGVFTAELLEAEAPKTCAEFKKHLPFTLGTTHSTCAGQAVVCFPQDFNMVPEHQHTIGIYPGTLGFLCKKPEWMIPDEIYITYGRYFVPRGFRIDYQEPINVFAEIKDHLDELAKIGERIHLCGKETVTFRLLED